MTRPGRNRGQLVLLAAAVIAVALTPVVLAVLQLGYHPDVDASRGYDDPGRSAERALSRAVTDAAAGVPADYPWSDRRDAVTAVRRRLRPRLRSLATGRVESGTVVDADYNASAAAAWAAGGCPGGPDRRFGPCAVDRGVVVQERDGRTHVLAVAFDVAVTEPRVRTRFTVVVRVVGGVAPSLAPHSAAASRVVSPPPASRS